MSAPLYIGAEEARRLLDPASVLRVVERALTDLSEGRILSGTKGGLTLSDDNGHRHMGAISGCDIAANIAGVKWFAACHGNNQRGLPRVPATIVLCDAVTGLLAGVIDATSMTAVRTAALAICALRPCVPKRLRKVVILGFGSIGQMIAKYMASQVDVGKIVVASRSGATAGIAKAMTRQGGPRISVESRLDEAVRDADLVVTATGLSKNAPLVDADWLESNVTICALGSYQEIDGRIASVADKIYVDNWEACQQRGNIAPLIQSGVLTRADIDGEVPDLVAGRLPGRSSMDKTVLIVLVGIGALDIALGAEVLKQARLRGAGCSLG